MAARRRGSCAACRALLLCAGLAAALLALGPRPAAAIYEDQAGTFDWYKQFVGRPTWAAFLPGKERVFVATRQQLLGSLHSKGGAVAWRRTHPEPDTLDGALALSKPAVLLAASGGCTVLRAWDALDGNFRWEALVSADPTPASPAATCGLAAVELQGAKSQAAAIAAGDTLQLFGGSKGEPLWSARLGEAAGAAARRLVAVAGDSISVVAFTPGAVGVFVASFAAADGSPLSEPRQLQAAARLGATAAVSGSAVAILSEDGQQLCTLQLPVAEDAESVSCRTLASAASSLTPAGPGSFSLASPAGVAIIAAGSQDSAAQQFPDAAAASPASDGLLALAASSTDGASVSVQLLDAASLQTVERASVAVPQPAYPASGPAPRVVAAWLDASRRGGVTATSGKPALQGCRLLLLWSDDALTFIEAGSVAWSREEALASGVSSLLIDLPAAAAAAGAADGSGSGAARGGLLGLLSDRDALKRWVRLQVLGVLVQFRLNTDPEKAEFYELRQALSDNNLPFRDTTGFRKLIVLLTEPGKLFGLHSGDGRILWTAAAVAPPDAGAGTHLRVWRRFHDLTHAPQLVVLSLGAGGARGHVLNGHTGSTLLTLELPRGVDKVVPLSSPAHDGAAEQFAFLLVEPAPAVGSASDDTASAPLPRVRLLPDTPATQDQLSASAADLLFWLLVPAAPGAPATTVLRGYGLAPGARPGGDGLLPVVPAWQAVLPGSLLALAARDPNEPVHSYVKVLGDRSLKYKFVNPNLLFVATSTTTSPGGGSGASPAVPPDEQRLSVALLNTVTGAVLHQQAHSGVTGPVHALVSEHWVVYTSWDAVQLRQQATVIELYDATPRDLSIEAVLLGRTRHAASLSSYAAMPLEVLSQSFYLQGAIKGLWVTQTLAGITTKQLLLRTASDQLYALDKRYLDPRRPLAAKATPHEAEEGLLPYSELIIFSTLAYPTQDKQVLNLRGVAVAPAVLESTTLLFCHGSDLFFTRVTPAAHFDSLPPDFSYGLLVVAMLALLGGTWFASYSSQQAMLKAKWQ